MNQQDEHAVQNRSKKPRRLTVSYMNTDKTGVDVLYLRGRWAARRRLHYRPAHEDRSQQGRLMIVQVD
jgi:hypothetical protein